MDFFPIFINLKGRACLVVGGGDTAFRKTSALLRAGALVRVVSPDLCEAFKALPEIEYTPEKFQVHHLDGMTLAVAATNSLDTNRAVFDEAKSKNILVNVVDNPALCTFIMPAILDRSPLMIAFSTGGASPVLARILRAKLEALIPPGYGQLTAFCAKFRQAVKSRIAHPGQRRIFWEKVLEGPVAEGVLSGLERPAEDSLMAMLDSDTHESAGEVFLVGAGPGAQDLLTFRALRLMQKADVVLYDNLVSKEVLDMTRRDAKRIFVGKTRGCHTMEQESINDLLVRLAKEGKRVLRLKGGDPFIFGRGGEEIETLSRHKISFQVVPGITAACGVAAYAGIPLTHRDHAQSCVFVTGHMKDGNMSLDWEMLARPNQTVVVYMGLHGLEMLCAKLITHGLPEGTPAAIVQQGTTRNQRVVCGTLATLPKAAAAAMLKAPTLIIVGGVVELREKLAWFNPDQAGEQKI